MLNLNAGGQARYVRALWVSGTYFQVLGVKPEQGRLLGPADDRAELPDAGSRHQLSVLAAGVRRRP